MKNIYETVAIFTTNTEEEIIKAEIKKFNDIIQSYSTKKKVKLDDLGEKKLAYEIKGNKSGYYALFYWEGTNKNVIDLERQLRIDDYVIKFMTIKTNEMENKILLANYKPEEETKSEQDQQPDALDVLLGLAEFKKKGEIKCC